MSLENLQYLTIAIDMLISKQGPKYLDWLSWAVCLSSICYLFLIIAISFKSDGRVVQGSNKKKDSLHITPLPKLTTTTTRKEIGDIKNILIWNQYVMPFHLIEYGHDSFINNKCKHTNCFLTGDRNYLPDVRDFDAVIFSGCGLRRLSRSLLPKKRSVIQKYVFATVEPSAIYPVTDPVFDNFFNWTWTHRLHSDILWRYLNVYDSNGTVIGPIVNVKWPKNMKPTDSYTKSKLKSKRKAAAWFVSHCVTNGHREEFAKEFYVEFKKYGWLVDVYGECGNSNCSRHTAETCFKLVAKDYHFYFAFENSVEEDYVSEKLLTALNNFAVPVVYGGADYTRFMPPGSYLDARKLGPMLLAKVMDEAIRNKSIYYDFFRWRNHFRYNASDRTSDLCNICTALNNKEMMSKTTVYKDFRLQWNGAQRQKTYNFMLKNFLINNALSSFASNFNFTRENSLVLLEFVKNQSNISIE